MGVKEFYYSLEDKWYGFLDGLQEKGIPVYNVIDQIDKIVPSFALFLGILILLFLGISYFVFFSAPAENVPEGQVMIKFSVEDEKGFSLKDALIEMEIEGKKTEKKTSSSGKAEFLIESGTGISVKVSKKDFVDFTDSYFADEELEEIKITLFKATGFEYSSKTVYFVDSSGKSIEGKNIRAEFSCSNSEAVLPESSFDAITSGQVELSIPKNCGSLQARVFVEGFESKNISLSPQESIVRLQEINSGTDEFTATLIVKAIEKETRAPLRGIQLELRNDSGELIDAGFTDSSGEKYFSAPWDDYKITAIDPNAEHVQTTHSFTVNSNSKQVTIEMQRDPYAKITASAVDSGTNQAVPAVIYLRKGTELIPIETTSSNLKAEFLLESPGTYYLRTGKEGYISSSEQEVEITQKAQEKEINLLIEPCTPAKCSALKISVIDEDALPVENALINLHEAGTGFVQTQYAQRTTDENGLAQPVYTEVESGNYYASATKYPASASSNEFEVIQGKPMEVTIDFVIGEALIEIQAMDSFNEPVPFAKVEFFNPIGELLGEMETSEEGMLSTKLKADKEIYVKISKKEFTSWTSELIQLYPDKVFFINAELEKEILGDTPLIEFLGLMEKNTDYAVEEPEPATTYDALFELIIPSETDFDEAGIHLRTGFMDNIEKDDLFYSKISAPMTTQLKGKTFAQENNGIEEITNGEAKWINLIWKKPEPGKYRIKAEVKIKSNAPPGAELPIYFRAGGKEKNEFFRDPYDDELGTGEEISGKKALYANAYAKIYYQEKPCFEEFCWNERMFD
ncbi:MAG: hypothetical protein ABIA76_00955, partial [Candidatus Diapherotrites archaeon]